MASWQELTEELDRWHDAGATASFWWRDDDAVDATPQLDLLLKHAGEIPIALAVVPALATRNLAERISTHASVVVLQHGWRHTNHEIGENSEYPGGRSMDDVAQELAEGRRLLTELFGSRAIPVFVPPWHGFDSRFLPLLRRSGLAAISRKGPRLERSAAGSIFQANAHVALIRWSTPPAFGEDEHYISQLIDHLRGRRLGHYEAMEATGLLTHHLVQDEKSYAFLSQFLELVCSHPACNWPDIEDIFNPDNVMRSQEKPHQS